MVVLTLPVAAAADGPAGFRVDPAHTGAAQGSCVERSSSTTSAPAARVANRIGVVRLRGKGTKVKGKAVMRTPVLKRCGRRRVR